MKERVGEAVKLNLVGCSVGDVNASDVALAAEAGNVVILGFNVGIADTSTRNDAKQMDVQILRDSVIYRLEEGLIERMHALMPQERVMREEGVAKVQKIFNLNNKDATTVAGLVVKDGMLRSGPDFVYTVKRGGEITHENATAMELRRFRDVVTEVEKGLECGLTLAKLKDLQEGDDVFCYSVEWKTRELILELAADEMSRTMSA